MRIDGADWERWQYKPSAVGRIWYAIIPATSGAKDAGVRGGESRLDLPLQRVHSGTTFRGLMSGFMASLVYLDLRRRFDKSADLNPSEALALARNLECKVYYCPVIVQEPVKTTKQAAEVLKLQTPETKTRSGDQPEIAARLTTAPPLCPSLGCNWFPRTGRA